MKWLVPSKHKLAPFLQDQLGAYSKKSLRKILEANLCRLNGRIERFGSKQILKGDVIELAPSYKSILVPKPMHFETLYDDDDLKIISKPAGFICNDREILKAFGPNVFLAHRLDKDTTGALILAKGKENRDLMMDLFKKREVKKSYLVLVDGVVKEAKGERKSLFGKKGTYQGQTIWGSCNQGPVALTHWEVLATGKKASLVLCKPITGRTHQIRVHMAEMKHPILIDRQYATSFRCPIFAQRPLLHSYQVQFVFKDKQIDIVASIPDDFKEAASCTKIPLLAF